MGSGHYWAVVYGMPDMFEGANKKLLKDDALLDAVYDLMNKHKLDSGYEAEPKYVGKILLSTLGDSDLPEVPANSVPIDDFATTVKKAIGTKKLREAEKVWSKFKEDAKELGVVVPFGKLLWVGDYD